MVNNVYTEKSNSCNLTNIPKKIEEGAKLAFNTVQTEINNGLIACDNLIKRNVGTFRPIVPIVKAIAGVILVSLAFSMAPLLTLGITAIVFIHKMNLFPPTKTFVNLCNTIWNTVFPPFDKDINQQNVLFCMGILASWAVPTLALPAVAGLMVGSQLAKAVKTAREI